jgi:hypothetical protein
MREALRNYQIFQINGIFGGGGHHISWQGPGFNPFRVEVEERLTQDRRCCANPGLNDDNPFRVALNLTNEGDFNPEMRRNGLSKNEIDPLRSSSGTRDKVLRLRSVESVGAKWAVSPRFAQDDGIRGVRFIR